MYTIGDFLTQIRNAYMAGKKHLSYPYSKSVLSIAKILEKEGYVGKVASSDKEGKKTISIELKYKEKTPAISEVKIVSKPSVRHYIKRTKLRQAAAAHGMGIISTSRGIMTSKQAQKEGVGGELICQIY